MAIQEDTQLACCFVTKLGDHLRVPEDPVTIPADIGRYGLSQIINAMLSLDPPRPFDFMVNGELVRAPLHEVLLKDGISAESTLMIEYMPAVLPPTSKQQCPHDDWVTAVVGSESYVATSGSSDGLIRSWDLSADEAGTSTPSCTSSFFAHPGGVTALARARMGKSAALLFSAGKDGMVRLWQNEGKGWTELLATFHGHTESVEGVAVSPDGQRLATCGWDKAIKLWRAGEVVVDAAREAAGAHSKTAKKVSKKRRTAAGEEATVAEEGVIEESWGSLEGHKQCVTAVAWIDAHHLLSGSWDHSIHRWDANTAGTTETLNAPKAIHCLTAASEHTTVFGSSDRFLRVWDSRGRGEALNLRGFASHSGWIKSVSMCPHSAHHFVTGSYDKTVKLWDLRSAVPLATINSHTDKVMCTGWLGKETMLSGGADCSLRSHSVNLGAD